MASQRLQPAGGSNSLAEMHPEAAQVSLDSGQIKLAHPKVHSSPRSGDLGVPFVPESSGCRKPSDLKQTP